MFKIEQDLFDTFNRIKDNPEEDINVYEFIDYVTKINNLKLQKKHLNPETNEVLRTIWEIKYNSFNDANLAKYICQNVLDGHLSNEILSNNVIKFLKIVASIDLNIKQQKKNNPSFKYDNTREYLSVFKLYNELQEENYPDKINLILTTFKGSINIINPKLTEATNEYILEQKTKKKN